jgi:hypothetical protein
LSPLRRPVELDSYSVHISAPNFIHTFIMKFQALVWEPLEVEVDAHDIRMLKDHATWSANAKPLKWKRFDPYAEIKRAHEQIMWIFGRTSDGRSLAVSVPCTSYFYIEAPLGWGEGFASPLGMGLYEMIMWAYPGSLVACELVKRKRFFGYSGDQEFAFFKVSFRSRKALGMCVGMLQKGREVMVSGLGSKFDLGKLYETYVDPVVRLLHERGLESTGWIVIDDSYPCVPEKSTSCTLEYHCSSSSLIGPDPVGQATFAAFVQVSDKILGTLWILGMLLALTSVPFGGLLLSPPCSSSSLRFCGWPEMICRGLPTEGALD